MPLCEQCHFPGITRPIVRTRVGTLRGQPVYRNLCAVCAANARRSWSQQTHRQQAQQEMAAAQARYQ